MRLCARCVLGPRRQLQHRRIVATGLRAGPAPLQGHIMGGHFGQRVCTWVGTRSLSLCVRVVGKTTSIDGAGPKEVRFTSDVAYSISDHSHTAHLPDSTDLALCITDPSPFQLSWRSQSRPEGLWPVGRTHEPRTELRAERHHRHPFHGPGESGRQGGRHERDLGSPVCARGWSGAAARQARDCCGLHVRAGQQVGDWMSRTL